MRILKTAEVPAKQVEEQGAERVQIREIITAATGAPTFAMRQFTVEPGGHTPLHTHAWEHEVYIIEGEGEVNTGQSAEGFVAGCAVFVPPNEVHQFRNTGSTQLRFLCMIPVQQKCLDTKDQATGR